MGFHERMLSLAAKVAILRKDKRAFRLGAIGIRQDGTLVSSPNGPAVSPDVQHHAEARLSHKLDRGATVYVVRVAKDGSWACAKPCYPCMCLMAARGVKKVYWSECDGYNCRWL